MTKNWISEIKKIKDIEDWMLLLSFKKNNYLDSIAKIVDYLAVKSKIEGVLVILNRPYDDYVKFLAKNKIKTDNLSFIDCSTKLANNEPERKKNVLFMSGPTNLSDIAIGITQLLGNIKSKEKFLVLDSLSTLLVYHNSNTITQFMHFISSKLRNDNVKGVIILLERDMKEQIGSVVSQFADLVLEV